MKKIAIILSLLFVFKITFSQSVYYDAIKLSKYSTKDTQGNVTIDGTNTAINDTLLTILNKYFPGIITAAQPGTLIRTNPFLTNFTYTGSVENNNAVPQSVNLSSAVSAIGNLNVTSLAGGISSFLVKRAKEELFIAIIEKLKDRTTFPELPILFPSTMTLMNSFDSWQYSNILNTLKQSFDKDLQQLLTNIPQLNSKLDTTGKEFNSYTASAQKRVKAIKVFFGTSEARIYLSALELGNGILNGQKIPDVINLISGQGYLGDFPDTNSNVKATIQLLDILSLSLESNKKGESFISAVDFKTLVNDPIGSKLFFGLLYQQIKNKQITFSGNIQILNLIQKDYPSVANYLNDLVTNGDDLKTAIQNLNDAKKRGEKDLSSYWAAIFGSAKQFLQSSIKISSIDASLNLPDEIKKFAVDGEEVLSIANDIAIRNYSAAVVDFNDLIPDDENHKEFKNFLVKYGSFVANIVQAQNADDAENAIEAVALPVGSYTIKQNSDCNISLNGYIGYGWDLSYAHGIYAPIGVSFSTNYLLNKKRNSHGAISLFVSVFDVGSIAAYQLGNQTATSTTNGSAPSTTTINPTSYNQQIKLGSIFAPGFLLLIEVPKLPFAVGIGGRRTPTLSYSSGATYLTIGAKNEFNVAILIDIPFITLHNSASN